MSDEGKPLTGEHVLKQLIWRSILLLGASMEKVTTWTVTGVAAIIALIVSNLEAVDSVVSDCGLRWGLILLTVSMLFGAASKQIGMAVANGLETITKLEGLLRSEEGMKLMGAMTIDPRDLTKEIARPFVWPISWLMRRGGEKGAVDCCATDKKLIRLWCAQLFMNLIHGLLASAAIIVLALSI